MTPVVAIIDYGAGNLKSVTQALQHIAPHYTITLVQSPAQLVLASHIILPGVGAFGDCIRNLSAINGLISALEKKVLEERTPFLGICVGMQLLLTTGHEHGIHQGLGWFKGKVEALAPGHASLKVPHMGWNELAFPKTHPLFTHITPASHAYFVHSYHCQLENSEEVIATTDYGSAITAAIARDNILGVQFHPEKSQQTGLQLFRNFLSMGHHATSR